MPDRATKLLTVDIGGTHMRAALVSSDGTLAARRSRATPHEAVFADALMDLAADLLDEGDVSHAIIGVAGRVDYRQGRLEYAPNLPHDWVGALDEHRIADQLGVAVSLANDADLAAVGEAYFGAARDFDDIAYLTISTGIGAGVLLGRRLVAGVRSLAEIGHTVIDLCALQRGVAATLEELGSGTALEQRARDLGLPADAAAIVDLIHAGHAGARELWNDVAAAIGIGVANLALLFSPQAIILGGGVGQNGDLLLPILTHYLDRLGPQKLPTRIQLLNAELGDNSGLLGAAAWHRAARVPSR